MRIQLSALAASVVLLSLAASVRAEKSRAWQTGKVIESGSQRMSQITGVSSGQWLHPSLSRHLKGVLRTIGGCANLRIDRSTLINNHEWKTLGESASSASA
jgi:hypothetical protein